MKYKINRQQKWIIIISVLFYIFVIGMHIIDANDSDSVNYKGGHPSRKGSK
ncbi:hypothetical protein [Eupransor demetentiae]|uniref:Uncharacterized protein n=1 Tax=Eupransor demetentiae TaxID=3109584 RepID=A0ABP0EST6_9LACO|nr:hypothetical protein R54876_GBNLAHCA_01006 [Lactobacillaceae bacterium LMG 33000]